MSLVGRPRTRVVITAVVIGLLATSLVQPSGAEEVRVVGTERASVSEDGTEGDDTVLYAPEVTPDGRLVAFTSQADNLVPGDTNNAHDVFVHDRLSRTIERVSVSAGGAQGNGDSAFPMMSADGRYVGFHSQATNLVPSDTNGRADVFVHDRWTGTTALISRTPSGAVGNGDSADARLTPDGRFVAFHSTAPDLVAGDTNGHLDVFVHDRFTGTTERVSIGTTGPTGDMFVDIVEGNGDSFSPAISADGRVVAFHTGASNLVPGDTNNAADVLVRDRVLGLTTRASVGTNPLPDDGGISGAPVEGVEADGDSAHPSLSADGRFVAFHSVATNLDAAVVPDTNAASDVFVHDRLTGVTERVSVPLLPVEANGHSVNADLGPDGRFVAFHSSAGNLVLDDTNGVYDVFVHDRLSRINIRVSVADDGSEARAPGRPGGSEPAPGPAGSYNAALTLEGRAVAFHSSATNLVAGDTNGFDDTFVFDLVGGLLGARPPEVPPVPPIPPIPPVPPGPIPDCAFFPPFDTTLREIMECFGVSPP